MANGLMITLGLLIALVLIWVGLFLITGTNYCPEKLSENYYYCESYLDCNLHPKYDCINADELNCFVKEDLSARQEIASMLACECVDNHCETIVIR